MVENLVKKFHGKKAVNNLSLTLFKDEILVLLGHNGAGKTTTINMFHTISLLVISSVISASSDLNPAQLEECSQVVNQTRLMQLDTKARTRICSELVTSDDETGSSELSIRSRPSQYEVWGYSLLMVTLIR